MKGQVVGAQWDGSLQGLERQIIRLSWKKALQIISEIRRFYAEEIFQHISHLNLEIVSEWNVSLQLRKHIL